MKFLVFFLIKSKAGRAEGTKKNRQKWRFSYEVVGAISSCVFELPAYFQMLLCRVHSDL